MISIVLAEVARKNEQYTYKLVGKGERYLVAHKEGEHAGEKVAAYLEPYAKKVTIKSVSLQKDGVEVVNHFQDDMRIFQVGFRFVELTDSGKTRKSSSKLYVFDTDLGNAYRQAEEWLSACCSYEDIEITAVSKTNLIEYLTDEQ